MSAPGVGFVTAEVVLSELAGYGRFRNSKTVCAYAGVVPAVRQSGDKRSKDMRITKEGSGLLRWALVESAWRLVRSSPKWRALYTRLKARKGKKRAIVALARRLLGVLYAMLRTRIPYQIVTPETKAPGTPRQRLVLVRTSTAEQTPAIRQRRADQERIKRNPCESEPPVERRPVDVTTRGRTPPAAPSPTIAELNGGVLCIPA